MLLITVPTYMSHQQCFRRTDTGGARWTHTQSNFLDYYKASDATLMHQLRLIFPPFCQEGLELESSSSTPRCNRLEPSTTSRRCDRVNICPDGESCCSGASCNYHRPLQSAGHKFIVIEQLVHFVNASIKPIPRIGGSNTLLSFSVTTQDKESTRISKIRRTQNQTTNSLARQALSDSHLPLSLACACSNTAHVSQSPLTDALHLYSCTL